MKFRQAKKLERLFALKVREPRLDRCIEAQRVLHRRGVENISFDRPWLPPPSPPHPKYSMYSNPRAWAQHWSKRPSVMEIAKDLARQVECRRVNQAFRTRLEAARVNLQKAI